MSVGSRKRESGNLQKKGVHSREEGIAEHTRGRGLSCERPSRCTYWAEMKLGAISSGC